MIMRWQTSFKFDSSRNGECRYLYSGFVRHSPSFTEGADVAVDTAIEFAFGTGSKLIIVPFGKRSH